MIIVRGRRLSLKRKGLVLRVVLDDVNGCLRREMGAYLSKTDQKGLLWCPSVIPELFNLGALKLLGDVLTGDIQGLGIRFVYTSSVYKAKGQGRPRSVRKSLLWLTWVGALFSSMKGNWHFQGIVVELAPPSAWRMG